MQPPAQFNNSWSLGTSATAYSAPALPATQQPAAQSLSAPHPHPPTECVLRHVGADPYLTKGGPLSSEEHRWAALCHLKSLQPSTPPADWVTRPVASIPAASVDAGPSPIAGTSNGSSTLALVAAPAASTAPTSAPNVSPSGDTLLHPDPTTSLEELRWRDYQASKLSGGAAPPSLGTSTVAPQAPLPLPVLSVPSASGLVSLPPLAGMPSSGATVPPTPLFPTPVRTLFPPTPTPGLGAVPLADPNDMDTSDAPDPETQFHSMYVRPENSVASPEEMRVVQVESYKTGRQVAPYWLVR